MISGYAALACIRNVPLSLAGPMSMVEGSQASFEVRDSEEDVYDFNSVCMDTSDTCNHTDMKVSNNLCQVKSWNAL